MRQSASGTKYLKDGLYTFHQNNLLGAGSFGKVYRGTNQQTHQQVAIKIIELKQLERYGDQIKEIICNQITVMRKFSRKMDEKACPYLVKQYDCFRSDQYIYIIMQLCDGGTLLTELRQKKFTQQQAINAIYQIAKGICYLAELKIVHRDLKPQNIFVKIVSNGQKQKLYKIGDFGFAAQKELFSTTMGTYPYMAPEVYVRQPYGSKADIWSLGVIAYELLTRKMYFVGKDRWQTAENVKNKQVQFTEEEKASISQNMRNFIMRCLQKDQKKRISAQQLLLYPLFNNINKPNPLSSNYKNYLSAVQTQKKIEGVIEKCGKMKKIAEYLAEFASESKRQTEFIEMYLLKEAYFWMSQIKNSLSQKKNYIKIDDTQFNNFVNNLHEQELNKFTNDTFSKYIIVSGLFKEKYKQFMNYINKFNQKDRELIKKAINDDSNTQTNPEILLKQLTKWKEVLKNNINWSQLATAIDQIFGFN